MEEFILKMAFTFKIVVLFLNLKAQIPMVEIDTNDKILDVVDFYIEKHENFRDSGVPILLTFKNMFYQDFYGSMFLKDSLIYSKIKPEDSSIFFFLNGSGDLNYLSHFVPLFYSKYKNRLLLFYFFKEKTINITEKEKKKFLKKVKNSFDADMDSQIQHVTWVLSKVGNEYKVIHFDCPENLCMPY